MADKINSYSRPDLNISRSKAGAAGRLKDSGGRQPNSPREVAKDAVSVSDTAVKLKRIEARLAELPEVDRNRVEALRDRIQSGDYQLDAARVAAKLLRMEQSLG